MSKVRIGIIGCGAIGSVHADAYAKVPEAEVVALCDILPDKLKAKAERHKIAKTYDAYHKLLADPEIDAVCVCVPNHMHAPIAIDAFKAGKHVFLEKPMTLNAEIGKLLAADVVIAEHIALADTLVYGRRRNHRMVSHSEYELTVCSRVVRLRLYPVVKLVRNAALAGKVAVVINGKKSVTVGKLNNIRHTLTVNGNSLVRAEFAV